MKKSRTGTELPKDIAHGAKKRADSRRKKERSGLASSPNMKGAVYIGKSLRGGVTGRSGWGGGKLPARWPKKKGKKGAFSSQGKLTGGEDSDPNKRRGKKDRSPKKTVDEKESPGSLGKKGEP